MIARELSVFVNLFSLRFICTTEYIDLPLLSFLNIWLMDYPYIHQSFECCVPVFEGSQLILFSGLFLAALLIFCYY